MSEPTPGPGELRLDRRRARRRRGGRPRRRADPPVPWCAGGPERRRHRTRGHRQRGRPGRAGDGRRDRRAAPAPVHPVGVPRRHPGADRRAVVEVGHRVRQERRRADRLRCALPRLPHGSGAPVRRGADHAGTARLRPDLPRLQPVAVGHGGRAGPPVDRASRDRQTRGSQDVRPADQQTRPSRPLAWPGHHRRRGRPDRRRRGGHARPDDGAVRGSGRPGGRARRGRRADREAVAAHGRWSATMRPR